MRNRVEQIANVLKMPMSEITTSESDAVNPFTEEEQKILQSLLSLPLIRQTKVIIYVISLLASTSPQSALAAAAELAEAANQVVNTSAK